MRLRTIYIILAFLALSILTALYFWLLQDDEPLDYSALAVSVGPQDSAINGYTLIRELTATTTWNTEGIDEAEADPFDPEFWPIPMQIKEDVLAANQANMARFAEAFEREQFYYDGEISYEAEIPDIHSLRIYVQLVIIKAQLQLEQGDGDAALQTLMNLSQQVARYMRSGGGNLAMIIGFRDAGWINRNIAWVLSQQPISDEVLRNALADYPFQGLSTESFKTATAFEFQLVDNAFDRIQNDPSEISKAFLGPSTSYFRYLSILFKRNRTENMLYRAHMTEVEQLDLPYAERKNPDLESIYALRDNLRRKKISPNLIGEMLLWVLTSSVESMRARVALSEAESSATYLLIAMKAYYQEHGELPQTLAQLIPNYIPVLPTDPYDGQPMRYDPAKAIIYAVGNDFVDNGGSANPSMFETTSGNSSRYGVAEEYKEEPTFKIVFPITDSPAAE